MSFSFYSKNNHFLKNIHVNNKCVKKHLYQNWKLKK